VTHDTKTGRSVAIALAACLAAHAEQGAPSPRLEDTIARYRTATGPGTEHRSLEPLVGSWSLETTWRVAGQEPVRAKGTSENRLVLGGRFLLCEASSGEGDARIEAMSVYGFDARRKQFFAVMLDNLHTYPLQPTGNYEPATRSFVFSGKERDEVTGAAFAYRLLLRVESADRHTVELFVDVPGGVPLKVLDAVYTRR
jgi:hypothetical protein